MFRLSNPFDMRRRRPTTKAERASALAVSTHAIGKVRAAHRSDVHARLLGFVEARQPEKAADISARLAAAAEASR